MSRASSSAVGPVVAPLAGSVDRNLSILGLTFMRYAVAPLAGSVDRNVDLDFVDNFYVGRSPRGERG